MQVKVVEPLVKKRSLKKVRRHFLHKTPSSNTTEVAILPQQVCENAFQMIDPSIGLVVKNRKICAGIRFLNSHFTINNIRVEDHFNSKAVSFNIELNRNNPIVPLEYHAKRLESYGNLDLAAWAQKIKDYQTTYPKVMNQYFELARSEDPQVIANLAKANRQAAEAQRLIQTSYAYKSVRLFSNGTQTLPLMVTYSEKILKEMDHSLESFCASVKESGIPTLFSGDSAYHIEMAKAFLSCSRLRVDPVRYGSEFKSYLYDRTGAKRPAVLQSISFVEPAPGGLFLTGCLIIKSIGDQANNSQTELLCDFPPKCVKEKSAFEEIISPQEL